MNTICRCCWLIFVVFVVVALLFQFCVVQIRVRVRVTRRLCITQYGLQYVVEIKINRTYQQTHWHTHKHTLCMYIHTYIYTFVCFCSLHYEGEYKFLAFFSCCCCCFVVVVIADCMAQHSVYFVVVPLCSCFCFCLFIYCHTPFCRVTHSK